MANGYSTVEGGEHRRQPLELVRPVLLVHRILIVGRARVDGEDRVRRCSRGRSSLRSVQRDAGQPYLTRVGRRRQSKRFEPTSQRTGRRPWRPSSRTPPGGARVATDRRARERHRRQGREPDPTLAGHRIALGRSRRDERLPSALSRQHRQKARPSDRDSRPEGQPAHRRRPLALVRTDGDRENPGAAPKRGGVVLCGSMAISIHPVQTGDRRAGARLRDLVRGPAAPSRARYGRPRTIAGPVIRCSIRACPRVRRLLGRDDPGRRVRRPAVLHRGLRLGRRRAREHRPRAECWRLVRPPT